MKIQEMKSGASHLVKKAETKKLDNVFEMRPIGEAIFEPEILIEPVCELDESRWSVVSFDKIMAGGLVYRQAVELITELDSHKVAGLCIVTDQAAARMGS